MEFFGKPLFNYLLTGWEILKEGPLFDFLPACLAVSELNGIFTFYCKDILAFKKRKIQFLTIRLSYNSKVCFTTLSKVKFSSNISLDFLPIFILKGSSSISN